MGSWTESGELLELFRTSSLFRFRFPGFPPELMRDTDWATRQMCGFSSEISASHSLSVPSYTQISHSQSYNLCYNCTYVVHVGFNSNVEKALLNKRDQRPGWNFGGDNTTSCQLALVGKGKGCMDKPCHGNKSQSFGNQLYYYDGRLMRYLILADSDRRGSSPRLMWSPLLNI